MAEARVRQESFRISGTFSGQPQQQQDEEGENPARMPKILRKIGHRCKSAKVKGRAFPTLCRCAGYVTKGGTVPRTVRRARVIDDPVERMH